MTFKEDTTVGSLVLIQPVFRKRALKMKRAWLPSNVPQKIKYVPGVTKLFIGALPGKLSKSEFRSHFESFGQIKLIILPLENKTKNINKGHGFVEYFDTNSVKRVLEYSEGHYLKEKLVN